MGAGIPARYRPPPPPTLNPSGRTAATPVQRTIERSASRVTAGSVPAVSERVRYRVVVSGRVQGVWYRESTRREADTHAVDGWVRNNPDGTVEAALEGPRDSVDKVVTWMRTGPRLAKVAAVTLTVEPPDGEAGFTVR